LTGVGFAAKTGFTMASPSDSTYLVNPFSTPVVIKINGRASYLNAAPIGAFFKQMVRQNRREFLIDFVDCQGMDSTFLGIIAGIALDVMRQQPSGKVMLYRLGPRNMELVRNLGLDRIAEICTKLPVASVDQPRESLGRLVPSDQDNAQMILSAHESLCEIDEANKAKFQDVIAFLRNQMHER
jgi:anti-anti-sigma regulatory factor